MQAVWRHFLALMCRGEVIHSDKTWKAEDYSQPLVPVGVCKYFTKPGQNPTVWEYTEKRVQAGENQRDKRWRAGRV